MAPRNNPFAKRRRRQHADCNSSRRFAEDRDAVGIAAERGNVVLHPLQARDLIQQPVVAGMPALFARQLGMSQEAESAQPVGDAHQNHALLREILSVVQRHRSAADSEPSAVDPDHHGQLLARRLGGRPDVQVEAILVGSDGFHPEVGLHDWNLHARRCEFVGAADPGPRRGRCGRSPAQIADGRRGERNAFVDGDAVFCHALDQSGLRAHGLGCLRGQSGGERKRYNCGNVDRFHLDLRSGCRTRHSV